MKKLPVVLVVLALLSFECCKKDSNPGIIQFDLDGVPQFFSGATGAMVYVDTLIHPNKGMNIYSDTTGSVPFIYITIGESSTTGIADSMTPGIYPNSGTNSKCFYGYNSLCQGFGVLYVDSASSYATNKSADTITVLDVSSCSARSHLISGTFSCVLHDKGGSRPNLIITNGQFINIPYTP